MSPTAESNEPAPSLVMQAHDKTEKLFIAATRHWHTVLANFGAPPKDGDKSDEERRAQAKLQQLEYNDARAVYETEKEKFESSFKATYGAALVVREIHAVPLEQATPEQIELYKTLIRNEVVHPIIEKKGPVTDEDITDDVLRRFIATRLGRKDENDNRRCYGLFLADAPDRADGIVNCLYAHLTPLKYDGDVIENTDLAGNVRDIVDTRTAPVDNPASIAFYSTYVIENPRFLGRVRSALVSTVYHRLRGDGEEFIQSDIEPIEGIQKFATLSPVPLFKRWLVEQLKDPESKLFTPQEAELVAQASQALFPDETFETPHLALQRIIALPRYPKFESAGLQNEFAHLMGDLCLQYLFNAKHRSDPLAMSNPVADFHYGNGAYDVKCNEFGNVNLISSAHQYGWVDYLGVMMNYLYAEDPFKEVDGVTIRGLYADEGQFLVDEPLARRHCERADALGLDIGHSGLNVRLSWVNRTEGKTGQSGGLAA